MQQNLCSQESLLAVFEMPGIEHWMNVCKASVLSAVLSVSFFF